MTPLVLVDGAGGFLGRHVVDALRARGMRVRATDRPGVALPDADECVSADLARDALEPLFEGATHVVHVAGLFDLAAQKDALWRANVDVARRVAEAAAIARVRRLVHVSSVTVYGRPRAAPVREDAPQRPERAYERSKQEGEGAVRAIARASGLPLVIARPSGIYGPHGRYGLAAMASTIALAAASGRGHRSVRSETRMTHVHVEDVASACALLCDDRATRDEDVIGRAFHVADATPVTWSDVARGIERFYALPENAPLRVTPLRARAMQIAARLASARLARTNASLARRWDALVAERGLARALTPRIDVDAYDYWRADHVYDTSALRGLGWSPRWPDARDGLRETLEWYVRERWLPAP
ncbi:NAD-dependent epimerase/dehydratase family protein [Sandaracinus amylolyticus]|uniref:NAD-dependent epimerase/dehydratase family protein n=1 Tax=Sandaracinus amylolyticus TaxID=927083 RepID=UPI001F38BDA5|nr:NAD(P)-dependent oxidoreductase [Sandaracinus amylolyticus]UJR81327.1 NAD-dependent epimerase/dehydratase [Sandaracinus amylolyticus]